MCGIAGVVGAAEEERAALSMVSLMGYRGPDETGSFFEPGVSLAACRLAIVDVASSHQPLASADGNLRLVCNGEVYNFRELRAELAARGRHGIVAGDAETVILAYEEWGDAYLDHLEGMFAFALWDRKRRELRLARDRFGEKPLYYAWDGRTLAFASEMKALLHAGFGHREVEPEALHHYLSFRAVPAPFTLLRGIRQLPAAHELAFSEGNVVLRRYYRPARRPDASRSEAEWAEGLLGEMRAAVRKRLVSEVPLGAFLSGGLDSTSVVALMSEVARPRTFFIGFDRGDRTAVDRQFARLASERLGTDHSELEMTSASLLSELPRILWHLENPSVDGYQYYFAYKLAKERVTVALSGQGGDELFAGYGWFHEIEALERWRRTAEHAPAHAARAAARLAKGLRRLGKGRGASRIQGVLTGRTLADSYCLVKHLLLQDDKDELYTRAFRDTLAGAPSSEALLGSKLAELSGWTATESISVLQMETDLCHILLRDTDAVSMAHSLEVRLPLLDHHLVEYVLSMPSGLKLRAGEGKHILKRALDGVVPKEILDRPKLGFSFPMAGWLRGPLRALADAAFDPATLARRGYFKPEAARRHYRLFFDGRGSRSPFLVFSLAMLELWHRTFIDARASAPPHCIEDLLSPRTVP